MFKHAMSNAELQIAIRLLIENRHKNEKITDPVLMELLDEQVRRARMLKDLSDE